MPKVGLIFKFQTRGLEPRDIGPVFHGPPSHFCFCFSFTRPAHNSGGTYKKENTERIAAEMNKFYIFVFYFCIFVVPS